MKTIHFTRHRVSKDPDGFRYGDTVFVRAGWGGAGAQGLCLGQSVMLNGQSWTPVLWEGDEGDADDNIDFDKTASLEKG